MSTWCEMGITERYCQCSLWIWVCDLTILEVYLIPSLFMLGRLHRGNWLSFVSFSKLFETHCVVQQACLLCSLQLSYECHCLRIFLLMKKGEGRENQFLYLLVLIFFLIFSICQEKLNRCTVQMDFGEGIGKTLTYLFCSSLMWSLKVSAVQQSLLYNLTMCVLKSKYFYFPHSSGATCCICCPKKWLFFLSHFTLAFIKKA